MDRQSDPGWENLNKDAGGRNLVEKQPNKFFFRYKTFLSHTVRQAFIFTFAALSLMEVFMPRFIHRLSSLAAKSRVLFLLLPLFIFINCNPGEKAAASRETRRSTPAAPQDSFSKLKLLFAGDVMMHLPEINSAKKDSGYDFEPMFRYVAPIISGADIAVANLETTFGGKPYSGYPQFSAPDTLAYFLKKAGFDLMVTANNHSADRSTKGIIGTCDGLDKAGMAHTGTFRDSAEKAANYPYMIEKNGMRLAFLNYTYGTNGLPVHKPAIVNTIDTLEIQKDIDAAHAKKAEIIIVVFHWGIEYQREPNEEQKKIALFCLNHGIDIVIGSHPHVLQPAVWETYGKAPDLKKGIVVYSLGNFVSNQHDRYTDDGMMFELNLKKNKFSGKITVESPAWLNPTYVYIRPQPKTYFILPSAAFRNDTSDFIHPLSEKMQMLQSLRDFQKHMLRDSLGLQQRIIPMPDMSR
jgi:poly-gamma-glutamate synthesis protein (capsule biosynthesis protein)